MNLFDLVTTIRVNLDEFDRGLDEARRRANGFVSGVKGVGDGLKDLAVPAVKGFQTVETVGSKALEAVKTGMKGFAAASTAVGGFGAAAVKSGMNFDSSMSKVAAISGAAGDEFQSLRDKALEMGAKTKFSASDAADAMTYMGMAGWKAGDMISGIEGIMNLAAASGEDLALTSDIVTDALTAFGKSAGDSGRLADIMAAASSNANTNVAMLGESFKYVAPVAGALGYTMEDTSLALGLMANSGIKASAAGTTLRAALTNMASPTKNMAAVMDTYGISLTNADGSMMSLKEVMLQLREKMGGLDEATQASAASMLFGKEAMSGMLAIINAAPEDFEKLTGAINDCNGAAKEMASTMIDNLQGDLTLLGSAFESLQIAISDGLTPTLREFAQFGQKAMTHLLEGFQGGGVSGMMSALSGVVTEAVAFLSGKAPDFFAVSGEFLAALAEGILNGRTSIMTAANEVLLMFGEGLGSWLSANGESLYAFGNEMLRILFQGFLTAGDIISENIGQFIPLLINAFASYHEAIFTVGLDILSAIGQGIVENQEAIQAIASDTIASMVTSLRENAPAIIEGAIALIEALAGALMENMPLILETGAEIVGQLVAGITTSLPTLAVAILPILTHIGTIIETVGKIKDVVKTVVEFVAGGSGIGKVIEIGKKLMAGIQALWGLILAHPVAAAVAAIIAAVVLLWAHCEEFREFFINLWEGFKEVVHGFADWFMGAWEGVKEFFGGLWDGFKEVVSAFGEWLSEKMGEIVQWVKEKWEGISEFFSTLWEGIKAVFSGVVEFFGTVFSLALEAVQAAWEAAVEFFTGVWEGIQEVFSTVAEVLGGFFKEAWEAVETAWNAATKFFGEIWDSIKKAAGEAAEEITGFLKNAWENIKKAWDAAREFFGSLWEDIKKKGSAAAEHVRTAFEKGWEAIKRAWDGAAAFFSGILEKIIGVFANVGSRFLSIGKNIVDGIKNGISNAWSSFITWLGGKIGGIVDAVKGMLGIHSPSKVFADIGGNMALGLAEGWEDEYDAIRRKIERGLNFGTASVSLSPNAFWAARYGASQPPQSLGMGGGDTYVTINSPVAVDAVQAAREWKKTSQRAALGFV